MWRYLEAMPGRHPRRRRNVLVLRYGLLNLLRRNARLQNGFVLCQVAGTILLLGPPAAKVSFGRDRTQARAPVGSGGLSMPFDMGLSPAPLATFPGAPVFIPDGRISRLATLASVPRGPFPAAPKLKRWLAFTPCPAGLIHDSTSLRATCLWALCPSTLPYTKPTKCREPICPFKVLPLQGWRPAPPRKELPFLPRSYGLMCQFQMLHPALPIGSSRWSLQVAANPCCKRDLPDVSSASLSLDAWLPTPAVTRLLVPITSPCPTAFPMSLLGQLFRENPPTRLHDGL